MGKSEMKIMAEKVYTQEEILTIGHTAVGRTFGEIGNYAPVNKSSKGGLGVYIENHLYNYEQNNKDIPDFPEAGIELKVTPIRKVFEGKPSETYSAKERLVLSIINYMEEYKQTFESSHFWYKNQKLYLMFYEYIAGVNQLDLKIQFEMLYTYPEKDLIIIKDDWKKIIDKIKAGKAHELSEGDTMYLGACTKGADATSVRQQPFSDIMAKQRAYCLKTSYMTAVVRQYVVPGMQERQLVSTEELKTKTFEDIIMDKFEPFKGLTVDEIAEKLGVASSIAKNTTEIITRRILGTPGKITEFEEFKKANILPKVIRLEPHNVIIQSVSFPAFHFDDIVNETWEDSEIREQFESQKFLFICYRHIEKGYAFEKIVLWNMPLSTLDTEVKSVWEKTRQILLDGNILTGEYTPAGGRKNNFPKIRESKVCHVRPHGLKATDTYPLPVPDKVTGATEFTKQCFWLNSKYVREIVK